jgi:hypothetical protein
MMVTLPLIAVLLSIFLGTGGALVPLAGGEKVVLQHPAPPEIQEIELVYIDHRPPTATLKAAVPPPSPPPWQPSEPVVDLLALLATGRSFGDCDVQATRTSAHVTLHFGGLQPANCGYLLTQPGAGNGVDVLSYPTLRLYGETSGPVTFALVDAAAQRHDDNVPLTRVTGRFDLHLPLAPVAQRLDLRQLSALVVLPEASNSRVVLEIVGLAQRAGQRQAMPGLGFWVWQYRHALAHSEAVLEACQRHGCQRLLLQMPAATDTVALWRDYAQFLHRAQARGIEAFALDGEPDAIDAPLALVHKVQRLLSLMAGQPLAGVQLDVEPYLRQDFFLDLTGFERYLALIEQVRAVTAEKTRLSIVMPFWFTSQRVRGRPVAFAVMDLADEVAVMSYRTDLDELQTIARDTLRYGDIAGIPVWLALETRALPVERHVVLKREAQRDLADAYLDTTGQRLILSSPPATAGLAWFRVHHRVTVRPERLTFAHQTQQQVRAAIATLLHTVQHRSLAGILVHDLDGFMALTE